MADHEFAGLISVDRCSKELVVSANKKTPQAWLVGLAFLTQ